MKSSTAVSKFKVGDRVVVTEAWGKNKSGVIADDSTLNWTILGNEILLRCDTPFELFDIDSYKKQYPNVPDIAHYTTCDEASLEFESVINSPLYKALG